MNHDLENKMKAFEAELEKLINKHSIDALTNIPDFILASYLVKCIINYVSTKLWDNQNDK